MSDALKFNLAAEFKKGFAPLALFVEVLELRRPWLTGLVRPIA